MSARLLWIGDSITESMSATLEADLAAARWQPVVLGRRGWSTWSWLHEQVPEQLLAGYSPDVVVVALGTNDEAAGVPRARFIDRVRELTRRLGAGGARVAWVGAVQSERRNAWTAEALAGTGAGFVDGAEASRGLGRAPDGVHLTAGAYPVLARRLIAAMGLSRGPRRWWLWALLGILGAAAVAGASVCVHRLLTRRRR